MTMSERFIRIYNDRLGAGGDNEIAIYDFNRYSYMWSADKYWLKVTERITEKVVFVATKKGWTRVTCDLPE